MAKKIPTLKEDRETLWVFIIRTTKITHTIITHNNDSIMTGDRARTCNHGDLTCGLSIVHSHVLHNKQPGGANQSSLAPRCIATGIILL